MTEELFEHIDVGPCNSTDVYVGTVSLSTEVISAPLLTLGGVTSFCGGTTPQQKACIGRAHVSPLTDA